MSSKLYTYVGPAFVARGRFDEDAISDALDGRMSSPSHGIWISNGEFDAWQPDDESVQIITGTVWDLWLERMEYHHGDDLEMLREMCSGEVNPEIVAVAYWL